MIIGRCDSYVPQCLLLIVRFPSLRDHIGALTIICSLWWTPYLAAQLLTVRPSQALDDEAVRIRASSLHPYEHVVLRAHLVDGNGHLWESHAEFDADLQGEVDPSIQAPVTGSYKGSSPMGLIWSMKPRTHNIDAYHPPPDLAAQRILFELVRRDKVAATAGFKQIQVADGVRRINVTGNLHGTVFLPIGPGPHPGILVLGGSEGGLPARRAAWLASHGYAAFALAYFRYEDLPPKLEAIPLEYFGRAIAWMMQRPEILRDQVAVMGTSRGGELALQLGSMYSKIRAVVAYVPADVLYRACCDDNVRPYAWTWKGMPLPFVNRDIDTWKVPRARILVENTKGPILFITGEQDHVWESAKMAQDAIAHLKRANFGHSVELLCYPRAGHLAGRPEIVPEWHGRRWNPASGRYVDYGGTPAGNNLSSIDATPKVLAFLRSAFASASSEH